MKVLTPATVARQASADDVSGTRLYNLLNDFATLRTLLLRELTALSRVAREDVGDPSRGSRPMAQAPGGHASHLLDAFLLACGMNQILEDYLHPDPFGASKIAKYAGRLRAPLGTMAARGVTEAAAAVHRIRGRLPSGQSLQSRQRALGGLVDALADEVMREARALDVAAPVDPDAHALVCASLARTGQEVLESLVEGPRELLRDVVRLPSSFRGFDQHPRDCLRVAARFAAAWPDRATPLVVIGLRTSGSYLAPLYAASLRALGYQAVSAMTMRPGRPLLAGETARLLAAIRAGARMLLADDPPASGASLAKAARHLERLGVSREAITLLLPLFGGERSLPVALSAYNGIYLPHSAWSIHELFDPSSVRATLADLLVGRAISATWADGSAHTVTIQAIEACERLPLDLPHDEPTTLPHPRGHLRARFRLTCVESETGTRIFHDVYVKGVGLGYFGRYALDVAAALPEFVPETYGVRDGLLFRRWMPASERLRPDATSGDDLEDAARRVVEYVAARGRALSVPEDISGRLEGRDAVWQRAAELLGLAFGGAAPLVRPMLRRAARGLVLSGVAPASVVDGSMAPGQWLWSPDADGDPARLLKVDTDERAFSNRDLYSYDAGYDLASSAALFEYTLGDGKAFADQLRRRYQRATGSHISNERWLLHQLVALTSERWHAGWAFTNRSVISGGPHADDLAPGAVAHCPPQALQPALLRMERALARIYARYIGEHFFGDLTPPTSGPLCAIDIDGVFESERLTFPGTTPAGALALRALRMHGYRPVLVTGRSLDEVRERCAAYHLAGAAAEYGAVVYNHVSGDVHICLDEEERALLADLRAVLAHTPEVYLDPAYRVAVRAYRLGSDGQRRGLAAEVIEAALEQVSHRSRVRPILGYSQTDFMVTRVDKASGIYALVEALDGTLANPAADEVVLACAVGDSVSDLPMFHIARYGYAPANADAAVRDRAASGAADVRVMRRPYQAGLLLAVAHLLGHQPRGCATCRPPRMSHEANVVLSALGALDVGKWGKLRLGAVMALRLARGHTALTITETRPLAHASTDS